MGASLPDFDAGRHRVALARTPAAFADALHDTESEHAKPCSEVASPVGAAWTRRAQAAVVSAFSMEDLRNSLANLAILLRA
ncbi:hypothetical protein [Streptomyces sp. BE147]|uniref:hypothetical protein n=1 Tax=Streptomyces sp. BE147 TaxID=3002524 RepID=UPI002E78CB9C|nr:hypothetical protein [Streptomyces sp. BE147]